MKKIQIIFCSMLMVMTLAVTSCGSDAASGTPADSTNSGKGEEKKSLKPDVSPEMTDFMSMLKGDSKFTEEAFAKYESEGLDRKDLDMYSLKDAKVTAVQNNCYTVNAKSGMSARIMVICWDGGKIKSVEDKGMDL